jgi:hypothetical protein
LIPTTAAAPLGIHEGQEGIQHLELPGRRYPAQGGYVRDRNTQRLAPGQEALGPFNIPYQALVHRGQDIKVC